MCPFILCLMVFHQIFKELALHKFDIGLFLNLYVCIPYNSVRRERNHMQEMTARNAFLHFVQSHPRASNARIARVRFCYNKYKTNNQIDFKVIKHLN